MTKPPKAHIRYEKGYWYLMVWSSISRMYVYDFEADNIKTIAEYLIAIKNIKYNP